MVNTSWEKDKHGYFFVYKYPDNKQRTKGLGWIDKAKEGWRVCVKIYRNCEINWEEIAICESLALAQLAMKNWWAKHPFFAKEEGGTANA